MRQPHAACARALRRPASIHQRGLSRLLCCIAGCNIGIDLGTTNSALSVMIKGRPEVVPSPAGNLTTPSVIAFTEEGVAIGERALEQASSNVENTLHSFKRFMGRSLEQVEKDPSTLTCRYSVVCRVKADHGLAHIVTSRKPTPSLNTMLTGLHPGEFTPRHATAASFTSAYVVTNLTATHSSLRSL